MQKMGYLLALAGVSGLLWVALGAMTGHHVMPEPAATYFAKAHRYHIIHTLALMFVALSAVGGRWRMWAYGAWVAGMVFFCGGLYLMALFALPVNYLVPIGGVCFLLGWLLSAIGWFLSAWRNE